MPAEGGYSDTSARGESASVGIVTQVEGSAFGFHGGKSASEPLSVGKGVAAGDKLWVERNGLARVTDTRGGRITIAGPAAVEFLKRGKIEILRGSIKFKAAEGQSIHFENAYASGNVAGEAVAWASEERTQVLGLAGDVKTWHPRLPAAAVLVTPGHFTESAKHFKHLQPKRPARVDDARFQVFLSRFERSVEDRVEGVPELPKASRTLAAAAERPEAERGSRTAEEVVEPKSDESIERLSARMAGLEYEEVEEVPLAVAGPKRAPAAKGSGSSKGSGKPSLEIRDQVKSPDEEEKALLNEFTRKRRVRQ
jgi:hypothetical protein